MTFQWTETRGSHDPHLWVLRGSKGFDRSPPTQVVWKVLSESLSLITDFKRTEPVPSRQAAIWNRSAVKFV
jgi:hypothetical protein